ncbi:MAG: tetratricopeptide repeat protein [Candidatus Adiutrix sp.]|jgi:tetratricopeptide (TPR) repeat protein|nr:tetratricopeptide repeat protein [Candidatus Adiutrix sp.]
MSTMVNIKIMEGVYSETKVQEIGTMNTIRRHTVVDYYQCVQLDEDTVSVQILDMDGVPLPLKQNVPLDEFLKRFTYESKTPKTPSQLAADRHVAMAEEHVERRELGSAEYEYLKALKAEQEHVRAKFGLGKVWLETGEVEKAANIFAQLARQENMMEPENKHFFNDLGRQLRSLKLYDQAIEFYEKARTMMGAEDEHLLFNLARAAYESGDQARAMDYLEQALALNPDLEPALTLKAALEKGEPAPPA